MKKTTKTIALILSALMLLASLSACGGSLDLAKKASQNEETETVEEVEVEEGGEGEDEDAPYGEGAVVNEAQFNIATSADAFMNVTVTKNDEETYTYEDGSSRDYTGVWHEFYNNEYVYSYDEEGLNSDLCYFNKGYYSYNRYQFVDVYMAQYYKDYEDKDFNVGWNLVNTYSEKATDAGHYFVEDIGLGKFDEYTFDEASGKYISDKELKNLTYGYITHRELTFKDGVLVQYDYLRNYEFSGSTAKSEHSISLRFTDYGKTEPELPEELVALIEENQK